VWSRDIFGSSLGTSRRSTIFLSLLRKRSEMLAL